MGLMTNIIYNHCAFSDDSGHEDGRYNSLGLVTLDFSKYDDLTLGLQKLFYSSSIESEFKWEKVRTKKYRFAAQKINDFVSKHLNDLRIDVLIWDMQDSRHKDISNIDDNENLGRMYYHLVSNVFSKRWGNECTWCWQPDKQSSMDWRVLAECLVGKRYKTITDLFDINRSDFWKLGLKIIKISNSKKELFIQVADYFAGLGAYSYGHFDKYKNWLNSKSRQKSLFNSNIKKRKLSRSEKIRFPLLESFVDQCKKNKMTVGIESTYGLNTHDPRNNINFWLYQPQNIYDKAPTRIN
jgi:hypothetical protein